MTESMVGGCAGVELVGIHAAGDRAGGFGAGTADQLRGARPIETHAALRGIHGLGDAKAEGPQVAAEGDGGFPVDHGAIEGIGRGDGVDDDVRRGVCNARSERGAGGVGQRRGCGKTIGFQAAVGARQLQVHPLI